MLRKEALAGQSFVSETAKHFPMSAQDTSLSTVYEIVIIDRPTRGYASSHANMYLNKQPQKCPSQMNKSQRINEMGQPRPPEGTPD